MPAEAVVFRLATNADLGMGSALAAGDFDGDGAQDLAMGAPEAADAGHAAAGMVVLRYGTGSVQFLAQSSSGLAVAEADDHFGLALAAGDLDCDGYSDLAVGIPREDFGIAVDTGALLVFYGSPAGLPQSAGALLLLSDVDPGGNQDYAFFGTELAILAYATAPELAIGAPDFDIAAASGAGAVFVVPHTCGGGFQTGNTLVLIQGFGGVAGLAEGFESFGYALSPGDFNGDGRIDLAVGVPWDRRGADWVGAIQVFYGNASALGVAGNETWDQASAGVPGVAENGDLFGRALAAGDFDRDGYDDLAVGVSGEDIGTSADAGGVNIFYGSATGISGTGAQYFDQDTPGVINSVEASDGFGGALAAGDFSGDGTADLAIGVPWEDVGAFGDAGFVNVLYGTTAGLIAAGSQGFSESALPWPAAEGNSEYFGRCLATMDLDGDGLVDLVAAAPNDQFNNFDVGLVAVIPGSAVFVDGFESGSSARWSLTEP